MIYILVLTSYQMVTQRSPELGCTCDLARETLYHPLVPSLLSLAHFVHKAESGPSRFSRTKIYWIALQVSARAAILHLITGYEQK